MMKPRTSLMTFPASPALAAWPYFTVVVAVAVLFAVFRSAGEEAVTLAVFVAVPLAVGLTLIVTVAVAPEPRVPRPQVTVPLAALWLHVPCVVVAER
ncbi:MAG: hypothetical protein H0T04_06735 [Chloroflexi bacterium]|nr:hypothetical protein [Chloroflexota bacterium]